MKNNALLSISQKAYLIVALAVMTCFTSRALAQEDESKFGLTIALNSDAFFGFAPAAFGEYAISDKTALTFYGIFWSAGTADYRTGAINPSQGGGASWGQWTEFGVGVSFPAANGALSINPAIGVLGGNLLSGFGQSRFPDGFVPNLTVGLDTDKFEGEFYFGYYIGATEGTTPLGVKVPTTFNYVHYWASSGVKAAPFFSLGLLWEHLYFAGGSNADTTTPYYQSFGPYVQFMDPDGSKALRFSMGSNLADEEKRSFSPNSFWKLTASFSL